MSSPTPAAPKTLLIVEDEILPAMTLRDELQDAGYVVLDLTERRGEAIGAAKACKPDLALVNIKLQGEDIGIDIARDLKAMGVPVLFISGQVSRARTARTAAIGSFPKPYRCSDGCGGRLACGAPRAVERPASIPREIGFVGYRTYKLSDFNG